MIANLGNPAPSTAPETNGSAFPKAIMVTDHELTRTIIVREILGRPTKRRSCLQVIVFANNNFSAGTSYSHIRI